MNCALVDVVKVTVINDYKLLLQFDDGAKGEVDIAKLIRFEGIFAPLMDHEYFSSVTVNHDIGTICWENGADISPSYLRQQIQ